MSKLPDRTQIIVVGAGPTGLTVANLLAQDGIDVLVVERNPATSDLPRAVVLDDEGSRTMDAIGLIDAFNDISFRAEGSRYYLEDGSCFATVGAGPEDYGFPKRSYFHQPELEEILSRGTERFENLHLHFSTTLLSFSETEDGVDCALQLASGELVQVTCDYLLACDGGRSPVRTTLGIGMQGETYRQDWIVLDLNYDEDQDPFSKFYCDPARPWVSIPAPHGGRRYEFMLLDGETADEMLTHETLQHLLAPVRTLASDEIVRKTIYTFHARIADRLCAGRVLLLGDAAHMTPPFAGQGMNAGIRDTHNVAWKIAAVLNGLADPAILSSYEDERRDPIWAMIQLAVAMGEVIMPVGPAQVTLRDALVQGLTKFPEARSYFLEMKFKPKPRYEQGLFVGLDDPDRLDASLVGQMIPQPRVETSDGTVCRLDKILGNGFALVAQDEAGERALLSARHPLWHSLSPTKVSLRDTAGLDNGDVRKCKSVEPDYGRPIRTHRDQIMLIRPDRYVAGVCAPDKLDELTESFNKLLRGQPV